MATAEPINERYPGLSLGHIDPESGERRYGAADIRKTNRFDLYRCTRLERYVDRDVDYFRAIRNTMDGWAHYQPLLDPELGGECGDYQGYENRPADFKVHINPAGADVCEAAFALIDLSREFPEFRQALNWMKFGLVEDFNPAMPEIVLYPDGGSMENAEALLTRIVPRFADRFPTGPHRPRHNVHVTGACYLAQGHGGAKDEDARYREQYGYPTDRAILPEDLPAVLEMLERVRAA